MKKLLLGGVLASAVARSKVIGGIQEGNTETCCCPGVVGLEVSWGDEGSILIRQPATDGYETKQLESWGTGVTEPNHRTTLR